MCVYPHIKMLKQMIRYVLVSSYELVRTESVRLVPAFSWIISSLSPQLPSETLSTLETIEELRRDARRRAISSLRVIKFEVWWS